ncbi:MAG: EamA family transporter [Sphingobacteriia bacterium]|nr:EamA family transporter [Sphingobacteriia bacterium]
MQPWMFYAILSTLTGGAALVFAKMGMKDANENIALLIRTGILFLIVALNAIASGALKNVKAIPQKALFWFILAGVATAVYWIFFFKAMRTANVSVLSTIDKGSILVTFMLSYYLLKEPITPKLIVGALLIIAGTIVLIKP